MHRKDDVLGFSNHIKNIVNVLSKHWLKFASKRKVNIAHPYGNDVDHNDDEN